MVCKDCIHREICEKIHYFKLSPCLNFKNKLKYIELPCKIGDTVYYIYPDENGEFIVDKGEVYAFSFHREWWFFARYESGLRYDHLQSDIGKMVFLFQSEAENAAYSLNNCCCVKGSV